MHFMGLARLSGELHEDFMGFQRYFNAFLGALDGSFSVVSDTFQYILRRFHAFQEVFEEIKGASGEFTDGIH